MSVLTCLFCHCNQDTEDGFATVLIRKVSFRKPTPTDNIQSVSVCVCVCVCVCSSDRNQSCCRPTVSLSCFGQCRRAVKGTILAHDKYRRPAHISLPPSVWHAEPRPVGSATLSWKHTRERRAITIQRKNSWLPSAYSNYNLHCRDKTYPSS